MPKDATKNIDRYKIRGGQLNEFDFQQNQEQFAETQESQAGGLIPGTPPEKAKKPAKAIEATKSTKSKKSAKPRKATRAAKASKATTTKKSTKKSTKSLPRGATAKKLAARKAAKK